MPVLFKNSIKISNFAYSSYCGQGGGTLLFTQQVQFYAASTTSTLEVDPQACSKIEFDGPITGSGFLNNRGTGTVALSGQNTFAGSLSLDAAGTFQFSSGPNLGAVSNTVFFNNPANTIATLDRTTSGTTVGNLSITNGGTARLQSEGDWTITGSISETTPAIPGSLSKYGPGTVTLTGAVNYSGPTLVELGTLNITGAANLPNSRLASNAGTHLNLYDNHSATIASVGSAGAIGLGTGTVLTIGMINAGAAHAGGGTISGLITGNGGIAAAGTQSLILTASNTYSGGTQVKDSASLVADNSDDGGSATGTGNVEVLSGARLAGDGRLKGTTTVRSGALLSPTNISTHGGGIGSLELDTLQLDAGAITRIELNGITAGVNVDQINVDKVGVLNGTLDLKQLSGFHPAAGAFTPIKVLTTGNGRIGTFAQVNNVVIDTTHALAVTYSPYSVLVQLALPGDATLEGTDNFADLVRLAQNYNKSGQTWINGDFNGDGLVNFSDLVTLAQHYNTSASVADAGMSPGLASDWALAQSLVPEPTTLSALAATVHLSGRRRRREAGRA